MTTKEMKPEQTKQPAKPQPHIIKSIKALRERMAKPLLIHFVLDGEWIALEGIRLTGDQMEAILQIERDALPPVVKNEETGKFEYNLADEDFKKASQRKRLLARSAAIYRAVPSFWKDPNAAEEAPTPSAPPETDLERIHLRVMSEPALGPVLDVIYTAVMAGGVDVEALTNFFSGKGFPTA